MEEKGKEKGSRVNSVIGEAQVCPSHFRVHVEESDKRRRVFVLVLKASRRNRHRRTGRQADRRTNRRAHQQHAGRSGWPEMARR